MTPGRLREVLERHDPLATWPPGEGHPRDYRGASELAVTRLRRVLGVGHIWTVVADAIDAGHRGFYRAAVADDGEMRLRLGKIAREVWDSHNWSSPRERTALPLPQGPLPPAPGPQTLITDGAVLARWLALVEDWLEAESDQPDRDARQMAPAFRAALAGLVLAYGAAGEEQREEARLAFSRHLRARYQLAWFAGEQLALLAGREGVVALRRALLAESLLDQGLDWRDELMLLRDLRDRSRAAGIPFDDLLADAAACSSTRTAEFLRQVVREAPA